MFGPAVDEGMFDLRGEPLYRRAMWPLSVAAFLPLVVPGLVAVGLTVLGHRRAAQGRPSAAVDVAALAVASLMAALNVVVAVTAEGLFVVVGCSLLAAVGVVLERRRTRGRSPVPTPPPPSPPAPPAVPASESAAATAQPAVAPAPLTPPDRSSPPRPKPPSPATSGHGGLHRLTGGARLVVVDTETTGLFNRDRVIEVATIELDADGRIVDQWETLIAAGRDMGPTSIHRISPDMLLDAPTFKAIAGQLADRLNGAVLAGHNVQFDTRMLANEFELAGIAFAPGITIDTKTAVGGSLDDACRRHGVELDGHHRASADAMATARLLITVAGECVPGRAASLDGYATTQALPLTREQVATKEPKPVARPAPLAVKDGAAAYAELLGRCLEDLHLTSDQREELHQLAGHLGLSDAQRDASHHDYVEALLHTALERHTISDGDYDRLLRCAHVLGVETDVVEHRTRRVRTMTATVELTPDLLVCFTGEDPAISREATKAHAWSLGLVVGQNVTKKTELVVADHPQSVTDKAERARLYDLPIAGVTDFMAARPGCPLPVTVLSIPQRKIVGCPDCLVTSTVPGRTPGSSSKRCDGCRK